MTVQRLSVVVTRRLPEAVEARMAELFDVQLRSDDAPWSKAQLAEAMKSADVLVPTVTDRIDAAMLAGADGFLSKPLTSVAAFQQAILKHLPRSHVPTYPRPVSGEEVNPDALAYHDDLRIAAAHLDGQSDVRRLAFLGRFVSGVARSAGDIDLQTAAETLLATQKSSRPNDKSVTRLSDLLKDRLATKQSV